LTASRSCHINSYADTKIRFISAARNDNIGAGGVYRHEPFEQEFRTRGEKPGSDNTTGDGGTWYDPVRIGSDGRVTVGADITTFPNGNTLLPKFELNLRYATKTHTHNNYLPLTGGVVSGVTTFNAGITVQVRINATDVYLWGGKCWGITCTGTATEATTVSFADARYARTSDIAVKENVLPMTAALGLINQLQPVTFNYIAGTLPKRAESHPAHSGFVAQQLELIMPELVHPVLDDTMDAASKNMPSGAVGMGTGQQRYKGVDMLEMIPLLVKGMQELKAEIDILKAAP
jgi:hypothetical protein